MSKQSAGEKFKEWVKANHAQQPSLGAEVKAMTREATKDIRGTIHEVFFGSPERMGELGTPLNPTSQETTKARGQNMDLRTDKIADLFGTSTDATNAKQGLEQKGHELEGMGR